MQNACELNRALALLAEVERLLSSHRDVLDKDRQVTVVPNAAAKHRAEHRPGRPSRIETDAELRSFVIARIDSMTFEELAAEIAKHFPKERRVAKSALHAWWAKHRKGALQS